MTRKIIWRTLLALCLGILILGLLAPYLNANGFRERIREALQTALNRKVEVGEVHFSLFAGPGFSVNDVLIGDESDAGLEPFAHVTTLQARLHPRTFLTGHLSFSKLRLVEPSVNLVKTTAGPWNIQAFFQRAATGKEHKPHASFPDIQIVDGRIDFKFGLVKSVFYINDADVDIYPNSSGDLVVSFSGAPARTDRGAQGFGRFSARGLLHNPGDAEDQLEMALQLQRSALSELAALFNGRDFGVHGHIASTATLTGPLSHIAIAGSLNVSDLHRWDLMPAEGEGWTLNYRGLLNVHDQKLDLETTAAPEEKIPVALKFKATDFISAPKWAASMTLHDLPASSLVETSRHLGVALPDNVQVDGKVNGAMGISSPGGLQGELALTNASFKFPDTGAAQIGSAEIVVADRKVSVRPAELTLDSGHTARIEANYDIDKDDFSMQLGTKLLSSADLTSGPGRLVDAVSIPVLGDCRQGNWDGDVRYEKKADAAGQWSGAFIVQNAQLELPGIGSPLHIAAAAIEVDEGKVQIKNLRGRLGPVGVQVDYRFDPTGGPQIMRLTASEVDLAELEHLMMPTLRRKQGFLANLRLRRTPLPEWLKNRDIEGTVTIRKLVLDATPVCAFKAHLTWTGTQARFTNTTCTQNEMQASGRIAINLAGSVPQYHLSGQVQGLDYHEGTLDFDGQFDTAGTGADVLLNASSQGSFTGEDIRLSTDTSLSEISGAYQLSAALSGPRLLLTKVQANDGTDTFTGQGATISDGRIVLDLTTAAKKQVKLTGSLFPLHTVPVPQ